MTNIAKTDENKLPTIADIYNDTEMQALQRNSVFQVLVNQPPDPKWITKHPFAKKQVIVNGAKSYVPLEYIPIERIEWLLTTIFLKWRVEVKSVSQMANSAVVTVRLHYFNQIDNEWSFHDGIGAAPLQTDEGAGAIEWDKIKSDAVMKAAPAAESYAIKDAAEKIGKLFGKDLNRKDVINYDKLANHYVID